MGAYGWGTLRCPTHTSPNLFSFYPVTPGEAEVLKNLPLLAPLGAPISLPGGVAIGTFLPISFFLPYIFAPVFTLVAFSSFPFAEFLLTFPLSSLPPLLSSLASPRYDSSLFLLDNSFSLLFLCTLLPFALYISINTLLPLICFFSPSFYLSLFSLPFFPFSILPLSYYFSFVPSLLSPLLSPSPIFPF